MGGSTCAIPALRSSLMTKAASMSNDLFQARLKQALDVARGGNTAIVIVPLRYPKRAAVSAMVHLLQEPVDPLLHAMRATSEMLCFEGTRGSVRVYACDHITYDRKLQRLLDYPAGTPTFLHPEVETL